MTINDFAAMLTGREYGDEMKRGDEKLAQFHGFLVIFGASDDLTEFRGAFSDEAGAYGGALHRITAYGVDEKHDEERWFLDRGWKRPPVLVNINAQWCPKDFDGSWLITPDVPFASFDIMEDGELYCRGAVIDFRNLPERDA